MKQLLVGGGFEVAALEEAEDPAGAEPVGEGDVVAGAVAHQ